MAVADPIFRSQLVPVFLAILRAAGGDSDAFIRRYKLPADVESLREVDVPLSAVDAISMAAAKQTGDDCIGLHVATRFARGSYGLFEYIARNASTVRQGADRFIRYASLLNDLHSYTLETRGSLAVFTQRVKGHPQCFGRHASELFTALLVRYMRELTLPDWSLLRVAFAHPAPADTSELVEYFRAPLEFDCGENRLEAPAHVLERRVAQSDPELFSVLDGQARLLLALRPPATGSRRDFRTKIRARIQLALQDGQPQLEEVARALHMSVRTLQRRLDAENTSFLELVDQVREELARSYISNPNLGLGEVAHLLGFSDITAFIRAFKRWTGVTPGRWRAGSGASSPPDT